MSERRLSEGNPLGAKRRGRPLGSKNRPKLPEAAASLKDSIGKYLPQEDMQYLMDALEGKVSPELAKDVDIFLALQLKALLPVLGDEIKSGQLTREATSRSGTVKELLAIRLQMEKMKAGQDGNDANSFITNIFVARGIDPARLADLTRVPPSELPVRLLGSPDGDEQEADEAGDLPDELPERLLEVPSGVQE